MSRKLERLQRGVESLGAGDFSARVAVEGHDEVARLARSFNSAAGRIEQLMKAHKSLLANASHELRTPVARIRLAVELVKDSVDARRKSGLEQDIAELDRLLDEILLASRLDAVTDAIVTHEVDLLALAAEECARYDDAHLEGAPGVVQGDARLLRRLLRNLLENAARHGRLPTQVRITRDSKAATITVWDNGLAYPSPSSRMCSARSTGHQSRTGPRAPTASPAPTCPKTAHGRVPVAPEPASAFPSSAKSPAAMAAKPGALKWPTAEAPSS